MVTPGNVLPGKGEIIIILVIRESLLIAIVSGPLVKGSITDCITFIKYFVLETVLNTVPLLPSLTWFSPQTIKMCHVTHWGYKSKGLACVDQGRMKTEDGKFSLFAIKVHACSLDSVASSIWNFSRPREWPGTRFSP